MLPGLAEAFPGNVSGQAESAPLGADSLLDRAYESPAVLAEAQRDWLPDELPDVQELSADLNYLLRNYGNKRLRPLVALEYAEHLQVRFESGKYSIDDPEYKRSQSLSRLYLGAFTLIARRKAYQPLVKQSSSKQFPDTLSHLHRLIDAKIEFQKEIDEHVAVNPDKDSQAIFAALILIMHHSRRLLFDDQVTDRKAEQNNLTHLTSILAENKVLNSLRKEWPKVSLGTAENDANGTDIVVPSKNKSLQVSLQIKSSLDPDKELATYPGVPGVWIVRVPMNPEVHDPFVLNEEHTAQLTSFVGGAFSRQATLNMALQTGVDEVELAA